MAVIRAGSVQGSIKTLPSSLALSIIPRDLGALGLENLAGRAENVLTVTLLTRCPWGLLTP